MTQWLRRFKLHGLAKKYSDVEWYKPTHPNHNSEAFRRLLRSEQSKAKKFFNQPKIEETAKSILRELWDRTVVTSTVAERVGEYHYFMKTLENREFPLYCRVKLSRDGEKSDGTEEILIDQNIEGHGHEYISIIAPRFSLDTKYLMFLVDHIGNERYSLIIRKLSSDKNIPHVDIEKCKTVDVGMAEWLHTNDDSIRIAYTRVDSGRRPFQVIIKELSLKGKSVNNEIVVYHETDESKIVSIGVSRDKKYLIINSEKKTQGDIYALNIQDIYEPLIPISQFLKDEPTEVQTNPVEHKKGACDHYNGNFVVVCSSPKYPNFRVLAGSPNVTKICNSSNCWTEIISHDAHAVIEEIDIYDKYLILLARNRGKQELRIYTWDGILTNKIAIQEIGQYEFGINADPFNPSFRFSFSSPVIPCQVYDYFFEVKKLKLLKEEIVPHYKWDDYECFTTQAETSTSVKVPITLVRKKKPVSNVGTPLLLNVYGAYGFSSDMSFDSSLIPLMNRGWSIGFAHARGGGELGTKWHHDGMGLHKKNTFSDLLDAANHLISAGYADKNNMFLKGISAGGLAAACAINMCPSLFRAAILKVPFVDVITAMSDPTLPLTALEYEEWGNPADPKHRDYISSYDPILNIPMTPTPRTCILTVASMIDVRVPIWQILKYMHRIRSWKNLRAEKGIDHDDILLIEEGTGHSGEGGIFASAHSTAIEYSFLLHHHGS